MVAGTCAIVESLYRMMLAPPGLGWFVLAGLTIATGVATLRMPVVPISFSISDTFTIAAALLFGPEAGTLAVTLDALAISSRLVRREFPAKRVLFNATAPALAMWVCAHIFFWLGGVGPLIDQPGRIETLIGPLAVFASLYFVLNTGLIAGAVAFEQQQGLFVTWRRHFLGLWLTFFGGASIAALIMVVTASRRAGLSLLALVLPLVALLYLMFKGLVARMQDEFQHLASVNRMYHSLIHGAAYGIARVSVEGRFIDANPALASMLGYGSTEELILRNLWADISANPLDRERLLTPPDTAQPINGLELPWRRGDGGEITVRVSGRLVQAEKEEAPSFEMMVEDVTERRALEEQLREAQKLDAIGRLARGVAHDFNNLLTVIIGSGELARESLGHTHPVDEELRAVLQAAGTAASLTRQLLAFSRQQAWRPVELDVNGVIETLAGLLERMTGADVTVEYDLRPGLPTVFVDRGQLEQVVMNLVINARDAMPEGGRLSIATGLSGDPGRGSHAAILDNDSSWVTIRVADSGTGMSPEVLAHIFEPFFTTKEVGKGSGLGLATVYGIVQQSRGEIRVTSTPSEGTTFSIHLPASAVAVGSR